MLNLSPTQKHFFYGLSGGMGIVALAIFLTLSNIGVELSGGQAAVNLDRAIPAPTHQFGELQIISPNGGEHWIPGQTHEVSFEASDIYRVSIELVKIDSDNDDPFVIRDDYRISRGTNAFDWTIPANIEKRDDYIIRISDYSNAALFDESDETFSIAIPGVGTSGRPSPSIVLSPNGGETWELGKTYTVSWQYNGVYASPDSRVEIQMRNQDRGTVYRMSTDLPISGQLNWSFNTNQTNLIGGGNRIRAILYEGDNLANPFGAEPGIAYDESDAPFSIVAPPEQKRSINITSPQKKHVWQKGKTYTISWDSQGDIQRIFINLAGITAITGGSGVSSLIKIISDGANNGLVEWTVPSDIQSGKYSIGVFDKFERAWDWSAPFTIKERCSFFDRLRGWCD